MKIQLFHDKTGLIWGNDNKRISCEVGGTLKIGPAEIILLPGENYVLPQLFYGASGNWHASFIVGEDIVYDLGQIVIRSGRIESPSETDLKIMKLKIRADVAETERDNMKKDIEDLKHIFDTDSLNFLIN